MAADIAIIGASGVYAGAADVPSFWRNILDKRDCISAADAEWTGPYLDPQSTENDRIYTNRGGFLRDLATFNPAEFGIMPNAIDGGEPDQYLALRLARDALADAGYLDRDFDREKAGVVLGRGTYVNRGYGTLMQHGQVIDQTLNLLRQLRPDLDAAAVAGLRNQLKASVPAFNTAMAPGLVPNVVSGLICNRLNLMGPNHIIDAACASTLIAVDMAMRDLASGRADLMLSGGIQAHTPPQIFMIFCQLGALSRGALRPFDANAGGTLLGEGAGLIVLKRLADAERDGDRILAVIRGYGASSDGRAKGLLAPRQEGEVLAIRRAYADAGIDPATVGLIEAHGTGIALGDQTEIQSLSEVFGPRRRGAPSVAIGSVKSMISHCIPAAGSASIIKTALALHHKVLPPTLCDEVNPALELEKTPFYVNTETRPWVHGAKTPRRAGINAFGFGGVNAHLLLEEYAPVDGRRFGVSSPAVGAASAAKDAVGFAAEVAPESTLRQALLANPAAAGGELVVAAAASVEALIAEIDRLLAAQEQSASLPEIAAQQADAAGEHRLAVVASDSADLAQKLSKARSKLAATATPFSTRAGVHYGCGVPAGKLAVMFPGEGAQYAGMLAELALVFPALRVWLDFLDSTVGEARGYRAADAVYPAPTALSDSERKALEDKLFDMDLASESVFAASQGLWALWQALGLRPDALLGHSTGENSALVASGAIQAQSPDELAGIATGLNTIYRQLEDEGAIASGSLLTVGGLPAEERDRILQSDDLVLAMDNCPNQAVLFGQPAAVAAARERLSEAGAICAELPFGRAYHTAAFEPVARAFRRFYSGLPIAAPRWPVISCASTAAFDAAPDAIRDLACAQWAQPVRFRETVEALYDQGYRMFLEVGPSANLGSFVGDILKGRPDVQVLSSNSRRQPALKHFLSTVGALFASGAPLQIAALTAGRSDTAPRPAAPKGQITLKLAMPELSLQDVPPLPVGSAAEAAPAAPSPSPHRSGFNPDQTPSDPRSSAITAHFELMQEFLAGQQRVFAQMNAGLAGPADNAAAPVVATPLLSGIEHPAQGQLTASVRLDPAQHRYLDDHRLGAAPQALAVLPFTFSMELLAEAAAALAPAGWVCARFEALRGHRWLSLDAGVLDLRLEVGALAAADQERHYACRIIASSDPAPQRPVFEGRVVFAPQYAASPAALEWQSPDQQPVRRNPPNELYARGMFHGPRLQGVQRLLRWGERSIEAELAALPTDNYLASNAMPSFAFDAALLDAAGQLAGYWLSEKYADGFNCFPYALGSYELYGPPPLAGTRLLCRGDIVEDEAAGTFTVQWDLLDEAGDLIARASGWSDRRFALPARYLEFRLAPATAWLSESLSTAELPDGFVLRRAEFFAPELLSQSYGIWLRVLARLVLDEAEQSTFEALPGSGARREEWLMGRIALKEAARDWIQGHYALALSNSQIGISVDERGKPHVRCTALAAGQPAPAVSLSHHDRAALAVAGDARLGLGLDLQSTSRVNTDDLIRGALSEGEQALIETRDPQLRQRHAVALWAAKEAVAKATGRGLAGRPADFLVTAAAFEPRDGAPPLAQVHYRGTDYTVQWLNVAAPAIVALASTIHFAPASARDAQGIH